MMLSPSRLKKPCAYNGCAGLVKAGTTYCEEHKGITKRNMDKLYDKQSRNKKAKKFYSSGQWQKIRKIKLNKNPICEMCKKKGIITPATEVDHIIPIKVDWSSRADLNNLQSLCHSCHMGKTAKENRN